MFTKLFFLLIVPFASIADAAPTKSLFDEFRALFSPNYTASEATYRYKIFSDNLKTIADLNKSSTAHYSHLTQWADRTEDEFTAMHGLSQPELICQFLQPPPKLSPTTTPKDRPGQGEGECSESVFVICSSHTI